MKRKDNASAWCTMIDFVDGALDFVRSGHIDKDVTVRPVEMLRNGPYPWHLKQRISSGHGHLSNRAAAEGMPDLLCDRLRFLVLYHLSRTNNLPALALAAAAEALERERTEAELVLTDQFEPSSWLEIA